MRQATDKANVPHTLLLADDSVTIQRVIELTFADEDVQVVAVSDGDQAIARLDSAPPDIVLADIGMPGRNGYEVARYIKQSPKLAHIPVVLLTGAFEPVDQERAREVGCDGVLAKPFEPQLVIGRVKELLASDRKSQPATTPVAAGQAAPGAAAPPTAPDLDDYFDRLDVAFAKLSAPQPVAKATAESVPAAEGGHKEAEPFDIPLSYASPASAFETPASKPVAPAVSEISPVQISAPQPEPARSAVMASAAPVPAPRPGAAAPVSASMVAAAGAVPSLAEAFAAILAAEQQEPVPEGHVQWPTSFAPPPPLEVGEEVVDRITRRVLDQMSDRVVRETVSEIVAQVAERLVRDEIEKIKAVLK